MLYHDGRTIRVGDRVQLGSDDGVVVFSIETGEYANEFPKAEWEYLKHGIMVSFPKVGLVHIEEFDPALRLIRRS